VTRQVDGQLVAERMAEPERRRASSWAVWGAVLVYVAAIVALSSIPARALPRSEAIWSLDKIWHALEYSVLGALLMRGLSVSALRVPTALGFAAVVVLVTVAGIGDELYQSLTPGRDASGFDVIADAVGGTLGALLVLTARTRRGSHGDHSKLSR
jgi:VanZ family protein